MKRLLLYLILLIGFTLPLCSVNINRIEYFIDNDPGRGLATEIPITPGADVMVNLTIDLQNYRNGFHLLGVRSKDTLGRWSLHNSRMLIKLSSPNSNIEYLEYFFDTDPGRGLGTQLSFAGTSQILSIGEISTAGLDNGLHFLYVRCRNAEGYWSLNCIKTFYKTPTTISPIVAAEYFVDNDPGPGNGTPLSFTNPAPNDYFLDFELSDAFVNPGVHLFFVRVKNQAGYWSMLAGKFVYITASAQSQITEVNWYFSGNGANPLQVYSQVVSTPSEDVTADVIASIAHLTQDGEYQMHMYVKDAHGQNSMEEIKPFTADFSPNNLTVTFEANTLTLSWDEITGADRYLVMQRTLPYLEPPVITPVNSTSLTLPISQAGFFSVKAVKDARSQNR